MPRARVLAHATRRCTREDLRVPPLAERVFIRYTDRRQCSKGALLPKPPLHDLLSVATDAAYIAGRRTLAYFNAEVAVETKADATPVTRADREAEEVIRQRIARFFPSHSIVGEEQGETRADPDYKWVIDPIDGTKSFI